MFYEDYRFLLVAVNAIISIIVIYQMNKHVKVKRKDANKEPAGYILNNYAFYAVILGSLICPYMMVKGDPKFYFWFWWVFLVLGIFSILYVKKEKRNQ